MWLTQPTWHNWAKKLGPMLQIHTADIVRSLLLWASLCTSTYNAAISVAGSSPGLFGNEAEKQINQTIKGYELSGRWSY